ncbi:MAG: D-alanyl-D-alanine carboxypeptidase family protein [Alphaproteobacteria bacterium]
MTLFRSLALSLICFVGVQSAALAELAKPPFEVQAKQALMLDHTTGTVLYELNPDQQMSPSSMTKLMTAYVVFDALKEGTLKLDDELPVSERAWRMGGSQMFLEVGERVSVENLLRGMIVQSGNDACVTLAEGLAGTEEFFAEQMTAKARELGMKDSVFLNSHGLHEDGHYSTARDLARLGGAIIQDHPEFYGYYSEESFAYGKDLTTGEPIVQGNRNPILGVVRGADGLKTGYTTEGGYGLTASAKRDATRLILVVNGLPSTRTRAREAERFLAWGFRNFETYELVKAGQVVDQAPVWLGLDAKVPLVVADDVVVTLSRKGRQGLTAKLNYLAPIPATIEKGTRLGSIVFDAPDLQPVEVPVLAGAAVEKVGTFGKINSAIEYLLYGSSGD